MAMHAKVVRWLLEVRAEVDSKSNSGRTPLHLAAERGHGDVFALLLEQGDDVASDESYVSALQAAFMKGCEAVMPLLLVKGTGFVWIEEERSKVRH